MKKFFSVLFVLVMLMSCIATAANAEQEETEPTDISADSGAASVYSTTGVDMTINANGYDYSTANTKSGNNQYGLANITSCTEGFGSTYAYLWIVTAKNSNAEYEVTSRRQVYSTVQLNYTTTAYSGTKYYLKGHSVRRVIEITGSWNS